MLLNLLKRYLNAENVAARYVNIFAPTVFQDFDNWKIAINPHLKKSSHHQPFFPHYLLRHHPQLTETIFETTRKLMPSELTPTIQNQPNSPEIVRFLKASLASLEKEIRLNNKASDHLKPLLNAGTHHRSREFMRVLQDLKNSNFFYFKENALQDIENNSADILKSFKLKLRQEGDGEWSFAEGLSTQMISFQALISQVQLGKNPKDAEYFKDLSRDDDKRWVLMVTTYLGFRALIIEKDYDINFPDLIETADDALERAKKQENNDGLPSCANLASALKENMQILLENQKAFAENYLEIVVREEKSAGRGKTILRV